MKSVLTPQEILDGVCLDISECLSIELDEIEPESKFFSDLAGESIDVIDLMFRCERRFGIRIELQSLMTDLKWGPDGRYTAESVLQLQGAAPEIDWAKRIAAVCTSDPRDILTPGLICELVQRAHLAKVEKSPVCATQS